MSLYSFDFRYDMPTITKMTPEDLTAIGIKKPNHRKKIKAEIVKLTLPDGLPNYIPPTLDEFLHLVRLMEYRGLLANQGYLTIDDLTQISIEDLEDIGIYRLGHQKRLLLSIKRAKALRSGRRIAQYPTNSNSTIVRPSKPPQAPQMSSFQQNQPQYAAASNYKPKMENSGNSRSLVYQPDVIRIERAPSVTSIMRPPSCSPSPPPPPPPGPPEIGMPQPMAPLATSFQRYQPSFQYPQPPSWISGHTGNPAGPPTSGPRSFDDVDIALSNRNPDRILMHQHSASNLTTSGGTLPRLGKGFVTNKQRPVAKIMAKTREQPISQNSMSEYHDPKSLMMMNRTQSLKSSHSMENNELTNQGQVCNENSFPFANDNVGTIRMRSNSHVPALMENEGREAADVSVEANAGVGEGQELHGEAGGDGGQNEASQQQK